MNWPSFVAVEDDVMLHLDVEAVDDHFTNWTTTPAKNTKNSFQQVSSDGGMKQAWANPGKSLQPTYKCG